MAKIASFLLILGAIQLTLLLFAAPGAGDAVTFWNLWSNPTNWGTTQFIIALVGLAGLTGAVTILIGSMLGFKTDFLVFAPAVAALLGFVAIIVQLHSTFVAQMYTTVCQDTFVAGVSEACPTLNWILWAAVSPLVIYYVMTVIEFWRGRDQ